ncbi:hypothetical protein ABZW18_24630 [Streptomyces sp. NPDC004647]
MPHFEVPAGRGSHAGHQAGVEFEYVPWSPEISLLVFGQGGGVITQ